MHARSGAEVRNYLRRLGASDAIIEATLKRLHRLNYIDDRAFALNWALSRAQNQGFGPWRLNRELKRKGVVDAIIRPVIDEIFAQESAESRARKTLQKRFANEDLQEPRTLRRAVGFLQRRGYSSQVIFALLNYSVDDNC